MRQNLGQSFLYKKNLLQQIRGFYYVAKSNSFSEAARLMNLTQSTVTLQIQSLERDLKMKLLQRDFKSVTLTKDGEEFYKIACPLMHEFEYMVKKFMLHKDDEEQNKIDIAVHHIAISCLMPRAMAILKKSFPDAKVTIRNISPSEALRRLKENKIDLAFYPNMVEEPEITLNEIGGYDPVLIMNKNHPIAKKKISSLRDLKAFDLIRIDSNLITLPLFEEAVKTYKIKSSINFENGNWEMLKNFVKENDCVAIVSMICLKKRDPELVMKNLSKFFPPMNYSIVTKNGQSLRPVVQELIGAINESYSLSLE